MKVAISTSASDTRLAKPADLVSLDSSLSTLEARSWIDAASALASGRQGLMFPPWRQSYSLRVPGTDLTWMKLYSKPLESVVVTDLDGVVINATTYQVTGNGLGILDRVERPDGWSRLLAGTIGISKTPDAYSERDAWLATTTAGWLMPGQVSTWSASTAYKTEPASTSYDDPVTGNAYAVGAWVRATDHRVLLRFECTVAGTTGASEPSEFTDSATSAGDEITDGTVTWTARSALELPMDLEKSTLKLSLWYASTESETVSVIKESEDDVSKEYSLPVTELPLSVMDTFARYR